MNTVSSLFIEVYMHAYKRLRNVSQSTQLYNFIHMKKGRVGASRHTILFIFISINKAKFNRYDNRLGNKGKQIK